MMRLAGKSALVTGGARGIGRAFAQAYIQEGARFAIAEIDFGQAQQTAADLGTNALAAKMDVSAQASIDAAVVQTVKAFGQKKREVGNAVPYGRMARAEDLTGMAVFLASREADYIVAQTYNVDGGQWMS
ncbi:hypothetical protein NBRC116601_16700 [Cognatishimia sp. WU-CL00825]|uniref:SDR family oxidoreductase n=1 Tax=Cognatishimia sp. WU-CL00825 TaxID=3127658 RepID=UPI003102CCDA